MTDSNFVQPPSGPDQPVGGQAAQYAVQPPLAPRVPSAFERALASQAGPASAIAGIAFGVSVVLAFLATAVSYLPLPKETFDGSLLITVPVQLVGLAAGGIFTLGGSLAGASASISLIWVPAGISAMLFGTILAAAAVHENRRPTQLSARWISSGITGLVLAIALVVLTAVIRPGVNASGIEASGSTASVSLVLGALVFGTLAAFLGRTIVVGRKTGRAIEHAGGPSTWAFWSAMGAATVYAAIGTTIAALAAVVSVATSGNDPLNALTAALWGPTAGFAGLALMNLSAVNITGGITSLIGGASASWLPTAAPAWLTIVAVVIALALILLAGVVLRLRRPAIATTGLSWLVTIGVFAGLGIVTTMFGSLSAWTVIDASGAGLLGSLASDLASTSASIGPAPWTFLVFAIVGAGVEAACRFVAPVLIGLLPAQTAQWLSAVGRPRFVAAVAPVAPPAPAANPAAGQPTDSGVFAATAAPDATGFAATAATGIPNPALDAASAQGQPFAAQQDPAQPAQPWAVGQPAYNLSAAAPVAPMSAERKKKIIVGSAIGGGALLLIIAGSVAVSVVNTQLYSPSKQVSAYLDKVVAGDANGALELVEISASKNDRVLLSNEILKETELTVDSYKIVDVTTNKDDALVEVELNQDGEKFNSYFELKRAGKSMLIFDNWEFKTVKLPTFSLSLPTEVDEVAVNGVTVDLTKVRRDENGTVELPAFPGEYTVAIPSDSKWIEGETEPILVTQDSYEFADLEISATKAMTKEVESQLEKFLATCATATTLEPEGCPFYDYAWGTVTDVKWTIDAAPKLELTYSPYNSVWDLRTADNSKGQYTVTYTSTSSFGGGPKSSNGEFRVYGQMEFTDGKPVADFTKQW